MKLKINGDAYDALSLDTRMKDTLWDNRESKAVTLPVTYQDAMNLFTNDLQWSVEMEIADKNNNLTLQEIDLSDYAMAGPVTDNRNGTVTVKMGKYLPNEIMLIPLVESPKDHKQAAVWREAIETAMQTIEDDQLALAAAPLYPSWDELVTAGSAIGYGFRFRHEGCLYKSQIQEHVPSSQWVPGVGTESMYVRIDEVHAGSVTDPIPYDGNMELVEGLYYLQAGVTYVCTRSTGIAVYNPLTELVGIYVEVIA